MNFIGKEAAGMKNPHKLKIVASDKSSFEIWLDEKQIHHVQEYELKKAEKGNLVELTLKLLVKYPNQESNQ